MTRFTALIAAVAAMLVLAIAPASAQESARIHLLHGIPDTPVDVYADGDAVFEDFDFGDTKDLSALAGETLTDLEVRVAGTDDVAIDAGDVTLPSSGNYTIVAHLDGEGTPALGVFENDTSSTDAGEGRLVVRHAAAAPNVDILANGDVAFGDVPNGEEGSVDLAAGTISASVVPAGKTEPVVIGPADLQIRDGQSLTVYAVGSLDGDSLTVLTETIDGIGTAPARVDTGNSPVSNTSSQSTVPFLLAAAAGLALIGGVATTRRHLVVDEVPGR